MESKFKKNDFVVAKDTGTIRMKVIDIDYEIDEEANKHLFGVFSNAITSKSNEKSNDNFNYDEHKVFYVNCEWRDSDNVRHEETFKEIELELYENIISPAPPIIEGFIKKKD